MTRAMCPGSVVVVYLRDPKERIWGVLSSLDGVGVTVEGLDVEGFDAWVREVETGESGRGRLSVLFFPMTRVERILLDRSDAEVPSMADRFEARLGISLQRFLGLDAAEDA